VHGVLAYDTIDDLIADVDAVAFSVPPSVQADAAVRAADAGRHLVLEKPISLNLDTGRALVRAVRANGVRSVVFFTLRFDAGTDAWLRDARAQGGWITSQLTWFGSIFGEDSPYAKSQWRKDEGALWDVGPHALSLALPFKAAFMFRPGFIQPVNGVRSRTAWYQLAYDIIGPISPLLMRIAQRSNTERDGN
jgi:predicted dehydrogenase